MATLELDIRSNAVSELTKIDSHLNKTSQMAEKLKKDFSSFNISAFKMPDIDPSSINKYIGAVKDIAYDIASAVGTSFTYFTSVNSQFEQMRIMLETATGSIEGGKQAMGEMIELSKQAPFSIDALTDSFVKMSAAGLEGVADKVRILTDSISAFGGNSDKLRLVSIAVQQMAGKGIISMEELRRQFAEQVPTAIRAMAKQLDISILEMVKLISKGRLSSNTGLKALFEGLNEEHMGASAKRMNSFQGAVVSMMNEFKLLMKDIGDGNGAFKSISESIRSAANALNEFRTGSEGAKLIGEISKNISDAFNKFAENPEIVREFFTDAAGYVKTFSSALDEAVGLVGKLLSGYDAITGKVSMKVFSGKEFENMDWAKYASIRPDLIKKTELLESSKAIGESMAGQISDTIMKNIRLQPIRDAFDSENYIIPEIDKSAIDRELDDLDNSIKEKLSGKNNKLEIDVSEAKKSVDSLLKANSNDPFLKISKTMGEVASGFDSAINHIALKYSEVSENLDKENFKILKSQKDLADSLRDIQRSGMSDEGAWRDQIKQIDEYKKAAKEAAKAGNWQEQLDNLKRAQSLTQSLDTKGIKVDITQEDVNKAKQLYDYYERLVNVQGLASFTTQLRQATDEYNRVLQQFNEKGKKDVVPESEQIRKKLEETKNIGNQIIEIESKHKEELEKQKKAMEENMASYKTRLEELATQSTTVSETTEGISTAWVKVGDTFARVTTDIAEKLNRLQVELKNTVSAMNDVGNGSSQISGGRAWGGPVLAGNSYMVGENGPELFTPFVGGKIIPDNQQGSTEKIDITISIPGKSPVNLTKVDRANANSIIKMMRDLEVFAS